MGNHKDTTSHALIDKILDPSRIQAIKTCDRTIFSYNPYSFCMVFRIRGRNFSMIALPLLMLLLWGIGLVILLDYVPSVRTFLVGDEVIGGMNLGLEDLVTSLLTPVSFLMVFRLGRAATRYWDARGAMGILIDNSRSFIATSLTHVHHISSLQEKQLEKKIPQEKRESKEKGQMESMIDGTKTKQIHINRMELDQIIEEIARWTCVYPITVKNCLRPDINNFYKKKDLHLQRWCEMGSLLSEDETHELLDCLDKGKDKSYGPAIVLIHLRRLAHQVSHLQPGTKDGTPVPFIGSTVYRQLNDQIDTLTGAWGAMEKINTTPLPYVYVVHLRTFLFLYLCLWYVVAIVDNRWKAIPPLFIASWALLGIEASAVECERPFQYHSNHLPLGKMCYINSCNVAQTVHAIFGKSKAFDHEYIY